MKTEKELFAEQHAEDLKNKKDELARINRVLAENEELLTEMKTVADLLEKGIPIVTQNPRRIEPEYEFEKFDEYWQLQSHGQLLDMKRKLYALRDRDIPSMTDDVSAKKKTKKHLEEQIALMEKGDD